VISSFTDRRILMPATHHQNCTRGAVPHAPYGRNRRTSNLGGPSPSAYRMRTSPDLLQRNNLHILGIGPPMDWLFHLPSRFSWFKVLDAHHEFADNRYQFNEFLQFVGQRDDNLKYVATNRSDKIVALRFGAFCALVNICRSTATVGIAAWTLNRQMRKKH